MEPDLESILTQLSQLSESDFDSGDGLHKVEELCETVEELSAPESAFPAFFKLMERFPEADLGSPGPLVHTMERNMGAYEDLLEDSVRRVPTYLSVWMINRILNGKPVDRGRWVAVLQSVETNTSAPSDLRNEARHFLDHQGHADDFR